MDMRSILSVINELEEDVNRNGNISGNSEPVNELNQMSLFKPAQSYPSRKPIAPPARRQFQKRIPQFIGLPKTTKPKEIDMGKWMQKYGHLRQWAKGIETIKLMADLVANSDEMEDVTKLIKDPSGSDSWRESTRLADLFWPRVAEKYAEWAMKYKAKHPRSPIPMKADRYYVLRGNKMIESYIHELDVILSELIKL